MPTYATTIKYALRCLTGTNVVSDIDAGIQALADDIDGKMATYSQGLLSARPTSTAGTPGIVGRAYYATDIGLEFHDYGTGWAPVGLALGAGFDWYGASDPCLELMICDGRAIARTAYASLFTQLGTTFGVGNGSTTFNLPSTSDAVLVGVSGTIARGSSGGAKLHQHSHVSPVANRNGHMKLIDPTSGTFFADATDGKTGRGISGNTGGVTPATDWDPDAIPATNNYLYATGGTSGRYLIAGSNESTMQPYLAAHKVIRVL